MTAQPSGFSSGANHDRATTDALDDACLIDGAVPSGLGTLGGVTGRGGGGADDGPCSKMGGRGPIDHYTLAIGSEEELWKSVIAWSRSARLPEVTQFGPGRSAFFRDPDRAELEVADLPSNNGDASHT